MRSLPRVSPIAARWVWDATVTVLAGASALPYLFHQKAQEHDLLVLVLAVSAAVAPLLVRRHYPVAVFAWVLISCVGIGVWDDNVVAGLALLVALYTVAALRPRKVALTCAVLLEVVTVMVAVRVTGRDWWFDAILLSGMVAAGLGFGLFAAARSAYLVELHERAKRLARERDQQGVIAASAERARIAREMHDVVAHHLTVMVALSDGAIAAGTSSPERAVEVMRTVSATGRQALAETRRVLGVLHEEVSTSQDITGQALRPVPDLAELDILVELVRAAGLPVTLEISGAETDVPAGVQLTVYRLVQEALTNALKHAGPGARCTVRLRYGEDEVEVEVEDDGTGIPTRTPVEAGTGIGLIGMAERVHAYGGHVHAGPREPCGWRVSAQLRLDHPGSVPEALHLGAHR